MSSYAIDYPNAVGAEPEFNRVIGQVKWYAKEKGFGFIISPNPEAGDGATQDVFFHITEFKPNVVPNPGQLVQYRLIASPRGPKAVDCVMLSYAKDDAKYNEVMDQQPAHEQFE